MKSNKKQRKNRGITLIALVITIIVLLILAGVSIAMLTGENGIITQAQNAKNKTEEASEKEGIELAVTTSKLKNSPTLEILKGNLETAIREQFGSNKDFTVNDNGDGNFLISMNDTDRKYYVENTGNVIDESKMLKISTADELETFRENVNSGNTYEGWYVYLANAITLDINEKWEPIGLHLQENTSPDTETNKPFKGIFDGNEYEIDGIYINTTDKAQGLFGLVNNGKILNLGIGENCSITTTASGGAVAGYLCNNSYANNCYNKTDITIGGYGGGVFGQLWSGTKIENCYNLGNVNVNENGLKNTIGGVVGQVNRRITNV